MSTQATSVMSTESVEKKFMEIVSCVMSNEKTIWSVDFTTDCPKRREGNACKYCYVEASRNAGFNAKLVHDVCHYNGEILRKKQSTIDILNSIGGIRLFSFGDYMPWMDEDLKQFLADCVARGLKVKVITKQTAFVDKYANHPAISVIHLSVDNVGCGVDWDVVKKYRETYPGKVLARAAIMHDEDLDALSWVDIFTLNHANVAGMKRYSPDDRKELARMLPGKVCCETSKCISCKIKCGIRE